MPVRTVILEIISSEKIGFGLPIDFDLGKFKSWPIISVLNRIGYAGLMVGGRIYLEERFPGTVH